MFQYLKAVHTRACLKKAFCKMCVTICGRFCPAEGAVAGYGNRIRAKSHAKWGVQIAGMIFQTRSSQYTAFRQLVVSSLGCCTDLRGISIAEMRPPGFFSFQNGNLDAIFFR